MISLSPDNTHVLEDKNVARDMLNGFMEKAVPIQRSVVFIVATLAAFFCFADTALAGFGITPMRVFCP